MKKRIMSLLLTFCMVVSLLPVSALAVGDDSQFVIYNGPSEMQLSGDGTYQLGEDSYLASGSGTAALVVNGDADICNQGGLQ